jgi:hypothetical protein
VRGQRTRARLDRPAAGVERGERATLVVGRRVEGVGAGAAQRVVRPRGLRRPRLLGGELEVDALGLGSQPLAGVVDEALRALGVDAVRAGDVFEVALLDALDPALHLVGDRAERLLEGGLRVVFVAHPEDDRSRTCMEDQAALAFAAAVPRLEADGRMSPPGAERSCRPGRTASGRTTSARAASSIIAPR